MTTSDAPAHVHDTEEQAAFRAQAREFLQSHLPPRRAANPWALNFTADEAEARSISRRAGDGSGCSSTTGSPD
jgi:hypothetical protein